MIPALVLTAGLATRLRPLSLVRAKAALPIAGEALAVHVLRWLAGAGVTDAVLNLHHLPHTLTRHVGDGSQLGMRVRYSWESPVLGSAGGPRRALPLIDGHAFLIVNGDTLTDVNLAALVRAHRDARALVTMAVVPNAEPDKYGGVLVEEDGTVTGFVTRGAQQPSFHFIGTQVVEAEAFLQVPPDVPYESVAALYPDLIASRVGAVRAFRTAAEFLDIGTPADYLATALLIEDRRHEAARVGAAPGQPARTTTVIEPGAHVERSILWDDVVVGTGAFLRECVVADGVRVPADTSWHGVSLRRADGPLASGERRIEDLAIAAL